MPKGNPIASIEVISGPGRRGARTLEATTTIGRSSSADLLLDHPSVSRRHAEIAAGSAGLWVIRDLGSRNGTFVNRAQIAEQVLQNGDQINIGDVLLRFSMADALPATAPADDAPGFTIASLEAAQSSRVSAEHVASILAFGQTLQQTRSGPDRLRQLLDLLVSREMGGWWSYALQIQMEGEELQIRALTPPSMNPAAAGREPHLSRSVLHAVLTGHEPVVANHLAKVEKFQVDLSIASDAIHFAAVACPIRWENEWAEVAYVILPPTLGTLEWLMLISFAVEQYRYADAACHAQESIEARAAVEKEMALAQQVQARTLPAADPRIPLDWAVRFEPCRSVGGDYVDVLRRENGDVLLVVADAAGKGMQAALITSGLHAVFHTLGRNNSTLPEVIAAAELYLATILPEGSFVTLAALLLNPSTGEGVSVNCGHPPMLALDPSGKSRQIEGGDNLPLGVLKQNIESIPFRAEVGEWLIGYTDGLSEMRNDADEMIGINSLREGISRQCSADTISDASSLADRINSWLLSYRGPAPIADDRTLLIARRR